MFEVYPSQSSGDPIRLLVLTSNDQIHVFSHVFNGYVKLVDHFHGHEKVFFN